MNLIDEISEYIYETRKMTPSREWADAIATATVSLFSHNAVFKTVKGKIKTNLWYLYVGASGIASKTVPLDNFFIPLSLKYQEATGSKALLPFSGTTEFMIETLQNQEFGAIVKDEATTIFKDARKTYGADIYEMLSKIYDGSHYQRGTRKKGLEVVPQGRHVVFLGATTPYVYRVLEEEFFMQGLGNRIIYILWEGEQQSIENPDDFFFKDNRVDTFSKDLNDFLTKLMKCEDVENVVPMDEASNMLLDLYDSTIAISRRLYEKGKLLEASYYARLWEKIVKLASVRAIGDWYASNLSHVVIDESHVSWAYEKTKTYLRHFERFLSEWLSTSVKVEEKVRDVGTIQDRILRAIARNGGSMSTKELLMKLRMSKKDLKEHVMTLVEAGMLHAILIKGNNGRSRILLFTNEKDAIAFANSNGNSATILHSSLLDTIW